MPVVPCADAGLPMISARPENPSVRTTEYWWDTWPAFEIP